MVDAKCQVQAERTAKLDDHQDRGRVSILRYPNRLSLYQGTPGPG